MCLTDGEASGNDEPDVTDECAMLLRTEALLKPVQVMHKPGGMDKLFTTKTPTLKTLHLRRHGECPRLTATHYCTYTTLAYAFSSARVPEPGAFEDRFGNATNAPLFPGPQTKPGDPIVPVNSPRVATQIDMTAMQSQIAAVAEGLESVVTSPSPPSVPQRKHKKSLQPTQNPSSSRASVVFPILNTGNPFLRRAPGDETIGYGTLREDRTGAAGALGSDPSVCTHSSPDLPSSPHRTGAEAVAQGGSLPANASQVTHLTATHVRTETISTFCRFRKTWARDRPAPKTSTAGWRSSRSTFAA